MKCISKKKLNSLSSALSKGIYMPFENDGQWSGHVALCGQEFKLFASETGIETILGWVGSPYVDDGTLPESGGTYMGYRVPRFLENVQMTFKPFDDGMGDYAIVKLV